MILPERANQRRDCTDNRKLAKPPSCPAVETGKFAGHGSLFCTCETDRITLFGLRLRVTI
jgi:hypothetical protein